MNANQRRCAARYIIRSGSYVIPMPDICTLTDIEFIEVLVMYPVTLVRTDSDWILECPQIMEELHNYFWFGQQASRNDSIENPTQYIADWREERSS